jgi:hypothetical protein
MVSGFGTSTQAWEEALQGRAWPGLPFLDLGMSKLNVLIEPTQGIICDVAIFGPCRGVAREGGIDHSVVEAVAAKSGARICLLLDSRDRSYPVFQTNLVRRWVSPLDAEGYGCPFISSWNGVCYSVQHVDPPRRTHGPAAPFDQDGFVRVWDPLEFHGLGRPVNRSHPKTARALKAMADSNAAAVGTPGFPSRILRSYTECVLEDGGTLAGPVFSSFDKPGEFVVLDRGEVVRLLGYSNPSGMGLDTIENPWPLVSSLFPVHLAAVLLHWGASAANSLPAR